MMLGPLPEGFHIPTRADYDDLVKGLDDDIKEEGGPAAFLGVIRVGRKESYGFNNFILNPMANIALQMEDVDERSLTIDRQHSLANAAMSGMIFGHLVNESTYPRVEAHRPYNQIFISRRFLGDFEGEYYAEGGADTPSGRRQGYAAMAAKMLSEMSDESVQTVRSWGAPLIPSDRLKDFFTIGFGLALYCAWDVYTDKAIAEGRAEEVGLVLFDPAEEQGNS